MKFLCVGQLVRIRVFPRNTVMDTKIFTTIRKISSLRASSENSVEQKSPVNTVNVFDILVYKQV